MKKALLTAIIISALALLLSLIVTACLHQARADSTNSINYLDSALTIFSPINTTYNYRNLILDLTVPVWSIMGMPNNVSMNYTVDGLYNGSVNLRNITPSDAPPIATKVGMGAGYVDLPELPDGSHYITINLYGLNMLNYNPQFKSFVYTVYFSIDDPNSIFIPIPTPTPSPNPSLTPSPLSSRVQEHFVVRNTLYAFQGSELLCSFNASAGSWIALNITVSGDNSFETTLEVTSRNHGSISNSTIDGTGGIYNIIIVGLNYDDAYNVTVAKQPFFTTVTIKGTIDLYRVEPTDSTVPPTNLPLPSSTLHQLPSTSPAQQPTLEPSPTPIVDPPIWFTPASVVVIFLAATLFAVVAISIVIYFRKTGNRKRNS